MGNSFLDKVSSGSYLLKSGVCPVKLSVQLQPEIYKESPTCNVQWCSGHPLLASDCRISVDALRDAIEANKDDKNKHSRKREKLARLRSLRRHKSASPSGSAIATLRRVGGGSGSAGSCGLNEADHL